jgi:hypothetical protein
LVVLAPKQVLLAHVRWRHNAKISTVPVSTGRHKIL